MVERFVDKSAENGMDVFRVFDALNDPRNMAHAMQAVKKTGKGHWSGDRKQTTLWHISGKDQDAATVHGTQKPVECMRRPILNNSSPGQAVFEPFMGSGTTLIAAETTGRVCYGIELNPAYVDVAIERWQQFTGANAVLADTGETFADLKTKRL